jgi:hypothetical protein
VLPQCWGQWVTASVVVVVVVVGIFVHLHPVHGVRLIPQQESPMCLLRVV